jgi:hypothetical protein
VASGERVGFACRATTAAALRNGDREPDTAGATGEADQATGAQ